MTETTTQPKKGVKIYPAPHKANAVKKEILFDDEDGFNKETFDKNGRYITSFNDLLKTSCPKEYKKIRNNHIIQTSFDDINEGKPALSASNGFVDSVVLAYNQHHHLIIRPEDVWFSILTQLNAYINAHAEELRDMFVAHQGQKRLQLWVGKDPISNSKPGTMFGVDWAKFAFQIGKKMEENIKDPSLREWFLPAFTTTTKADQATASIIMMSAMQKYFSYGCGITCGLPSVTLLGEKSDWEKMLSRLERLPSFGEEPTQFYELLKPVVTKFVESFDAPESKEVKDFWQLIVHYSGGGSGPTYLSGWITAFCFWSNEGVPHRKPGYNPPGGDTMESMGEPTPILQLDNARYHRIDTNQISAGYVSVPVELNDSGVITKTEMMAGSMGKMVSSSGLETADGSIGFDTIQPRSGWCMYEVMSDEERLAEAKVKYEKLKEEYGDAMPEWDDETGEEWLE